MPIRILVAEDNQVMRSEIVRILKEDLNLEVVGDAENFAQTLELVAALKPDILVLDLHMPDERNYSPGVVKQQVLQEVGCILGISVWNDHDARILAEKFGAKFLVNKINLYSQLIPSIKLFCHSLSSPCP
jgi:DNA-binding NarL/FixJ family response regulator